MPDASHGAGDDSWEAESVIDRGEHLVTSVPWAHGMNATLYVRHVPDDFPDGVGLLVSLDRDDLKEPVEAEPRGRLGLQSARG